MSMNGYVGGAIDTANGDPHEQFEQLCKSVMIHEGIVVFNPLSAFRGAAGVRTANACTFVRIINELALVASDFAVFVWSGSPSFGMPIEVDFCAKRGVPFVIWNQSAKPLGMYALNSIHRSVLAREITVPSSAVPAFQSALRDFINKVVELNQSPLDVSLKVVGSKRTSRCDTTSNHTEQ